VLTASEARKKVEMEGVKAVERTYAVQLEKIENAINRGLLKTTICVFPFDQDVVIRYLSDLGYKVRVISTQFQESHLEVSWEEPDEE